MSIDVQELFEKHSAEFLEFERVQNPRHPRPDLCAFLILHDLTGGAGTRAMVCAAEHYEIWLDVDEDTLAASATEDDIVTLLRCGVRLDGSGGCCMFV